MAQDSALAKVEYERQENVGAARYQASTLVARP